MITPTYRKDQWRAVKATDIREVVADAEWQTIRLSFLGTWKNPKKAQANVEVLRAYVSPFSNPLKVRRVLNYLTGSAFRMGIIHSPEIEALREEVRIHWRMMTEEVKP
jgi:hypothetical protein